MNITGARWGVYTAEAILKLRALHANGDFDAYWAYHLQRGRQRNHPHSYALAACGSLQRNAPRSRRCCRWRTDLRCLQVRAVGAGGD